MKKEKSVPTVNPDSTKDFRDLVWFASHLCAAPYSMINLLDEDGNRIQVCTGTLEGPLENPTLCAVAMLQHDILIVPDVSMDRRFNNHPLVTAQPFVRAYAGVPLISETGFVVGSLCVLDTKPRAFDDRQIEGLRALARQAMNLRELRARAKQLLDKEHQIREHQDKVETLTHDLCVAQQEEKVNLAAIGELKQSLEIRARQYRELVECASDLIYELDTTGRFVMVNKSMIATCGLSEEQLSGMIYWELVHPDDRNRVIEFYRQQRKSGRKTSYLEFRLNKPGATDVWIGQNVRMSYDTRGYVYRVQAISRNITTQKELEQKLEESQQRFRLLSECAPVGIFQCDATGRCSYTNTLGEDILDLKVGENLRDLWNRIVCDEYREQLLVTWDHVLRTGQNFESEFRARSSQGDRWCILRVAYQEPTGGFVATVSDITEINQIHEKLVENESLYRLLTTNAQDMISLFKADETAERLYVSPASTTLLGYSPDELVGKSPFEFIHADDVLRVQEVTRQVIRDRRSSTLEYRLRKKDGTVIWVESKLQPFTGESGFLTGFQSYTRDITSRKNAELSLEQARQKAEAATESKSRFLSMMSHEIRTPMNAVIGITNLLLQQPLTDAQRKQVNLLKFSGENLMTIINDILDFSKIEAGQLRLESIDFQLRPLLDQVIAMFDGHASEKGISHQLLIDAAVPETITGDPHRLGQVLINLLGNAFKFTTAGHVRLRVTAADRRLRFAVEDTGIGIEPSKLKYIFERFSQADNDTTRKYGGTGLGLSISKSLVEQMGGSITVISTPGVGSIFTCEIPFVEGKGQTTTGNDTAVLESLPAGSTTVLLVEDNVINQVIATNFLQLWNMKSEVANNGAEALDMLTANSYDIILMDLQMPVMDGYEATRLIRNHRDPRIRTLPILALTASAVDGMREKILEAGMNDFVPKPFVPELLHRKICTYLHPHLIASTEEVQFNFDTYTKGDAALKKKLSLLLLDNLEELHLGLKHALADRTSAPFRKAYHKSRTAVSLVADLRFTYVIDGIRTLLEKEPSASDPLHKLENEFLSWKQRITTSVERIQNR